MLCLIAASLNFAAFGWGMVAHFKRAGKLSPALLLTLVLAVACASVQFFALRHGQFGSELAALLLYIASAGLFWSAVLVSRHRLAACGQGIVSTGLIEAGPYRMIRHPFYASYDLTWIAGFVATGSWAAALAAVVMASVYDFFARKEEQQLLGGRMAPAYRDYMERAGRYLPRLRH